MGLFTKIKKWWYKEHEKPHCGIYGLNTGKDDPLKAACLRHDHAFEQQAKGLEIRTLKTVNAQFLKDMKEIVAEHKGFSKVVLTAKAYLYYGIVKVVTPFIWKK